MRFDTVVLFWAKAGLSERVYGVVFEVSVGDLIFRVFIRARVFENSILFLSEWLISFLSHGRMKVTGGGAVVPVLPGEGAPPWRVRAIHSGVVTVGMTCGRHAIFVAPA